jgi:glycine cleavage system aminomethyltransferase T
VRTAEESFWVITGGGLLQHDLAWLRKHLPADGSIALIDFSGKYMPMGLWGPHSRAILQSLVDQDISNECFPFYTAQSLTVGPIPVRALRISYAGELGYELYASAEYGAELFKAVRKAGKAHGLVLAGGGAFDSLRLEKGYRLWGSDMHSEYNPLEAGLGWAVRWEKEFIGREALERIKTEGIARKLCCMTLNEPGAVALGKEPILADGKKIGYVTSANYGYSVGAWIVYGYLPIALAAEGTQVEVEYFGVRQPATVRREPLFDPKSARMKV